MNSKSKTKSRWKKWVGGGLLLLLCLILLFFRCTHKKNHREEVVVQAPSTLVTAVPVGVETMRHYLRLSGTAVVREIVDVFPETGGRIASLSVSLGHFLKRGKVIALIDPSTPGHVYRQNPVRTPITGTLLVSHVTVGQTVTISTPLVTIGNLSSLSIETFVPEEHAAKVKKGSEAFIRIFSSPDPLPAIVSEISPQIDPTSRAMQTWLTLSDPTPLLKPGMYARAEILLAVHEGALVVPIDSLIYRARDGQPVLYVVQEGTASERPVSLGIRSHENVEVLSGISPGESIVTKGQSFLRDGLSVRVVPSLSQEADASSSEEASAKPLSSGEIP